MRHRKSGRKLNRTSSHRSSMFRNMVTSLFQHGKIRTTDTKAKELRRWADHMVTLAKRGDLHARRQALAIMKDKALVHKLFEEVGNRFGDRAGGYTSIVKIGQRRGDAAPVSLIQLVSPKEQKKTKPTKKRQPAKAKEEKETKKAKTANKEEHVTAKEKKTPKKAKGAEKAAPESKQKKKKMTAPKAKEENTTKKTTADSENAKNTSKAEEDEPGE